jgi:heme A synthase
MQDMNPWLHRYAIFIAIFALVVIASGAFITSTEVAARQSRSAVPLGISESLHRLCAVALTMCTLSIAIWVLLEATPGWLSSTAWFGVATLALAAALGWHSPPLSPTLGIFHALLSHLFLSLSVVIAVGTSSAWCREPELVDCGTKRFLRPLSIAIPPIVLLQIILGAAYRHDMTSIMPHMTVAMGVVFLALIGSSVILQNFQRPTTLRHSATALISLVLVQVCLGITAFLMLVLSAAGTPYFILATVGHVSVGSATLAASVVMAMQVLRSVLPKTPSRAADAISGPSSPV